MDNAWPIILAVIACFFLFSKTKMIPSGSCYAVVALGIFKDFRGPGLHFKWSGNETNWLKLSTGDRGTFISDGLAKFQDIDIPVSNKGIIEIGSFVKITAITDSGLEVALDPNQSSVIICEKCGHFNTIA